MSVLGQHWHVWWSPCQRGKIWLTLKPLHLGSAYHQRWIHNDHVVEAMLRHSYVSGLSSSFRSCLQYPQIHSPILRCRSDRNKTQSGSPVRQLGNYQYINQCADLGYFLATTWPWALSDNLPFHFRHHILLSPRYVLLHILPDEGGNINLIFT